MLPPIELFSEDCVNLDQDEWSKYPDINNLASEFTNIPYDYNEHSIVWNNYEKEKAVERRMIELIPSSIPIPKMENSNLDFVRGYL